MSITGNCNSICSRFLFFFFKSHCNAVVFPVAAVHLISTFISMGFHALERYEGLQGSDGARV